VFWARIASLAIAGKEVVLILRNRRSHPHCTVKKKRADTISLFADFA
jgi:hypothetical protein